MNDIIINMAITGAVFSKNENYNLPITTHEILNDIRKCYELGISIIHLHVRDQHGRTSIEAELYKPIIDKIRSNHPGLLITVSANARGNKLSERKNVITKLKGDYKPDLVSVTLGNVNFRNENVIISNTDVIELIKCANDNDIKPELEAFDIGMLNYAKYLFKKKILIDANPYINI
ncbi:MAG: hypothetical protein GQ534_06750, partial [Candidatus Delongbacteria bacterium]|nr:hypothetical protein [Candidatus Delongbacteria bacterium]